MKMSLSVSAICRTTRSREGGSVCARIKKAWGAMLGSERAAENSKNSVEVGVWSIVLVWLQIYRISHPDVMADEAEAQAI